MRLTDVAVRNAKPKQKPYKITDGGGLFLMVQPTGGKWWRYKYKFGRKEKLMGLGSYPDTSLARAREKHAEARRLRADGLDPMEERKEAARTALLQSETSFEGIAREWLGQRQGVVRDKTNDVLIATLEKYLFPQLGPRPIVRLSAMEILEQLRKIEKRKKISTAHKMRGACDQIFRYAIATGRAERNPIPDLQGALKPQRPQHRKYLPEEELPKFLATLAMYDHERVQRALRLTLLTMARTIEIRGAEKGEFDLKKQQWNIPGVRMKMKTPHVVPLSRQAVREVEALISLSGNGKYLFPNREDREGFMSENTMLFAMYRMGYHSKATVHGFRATASTILNENGFNRDVIERQLAHSERDNVRAAYNHAEYLPQRREMMQWWADYLDRMKN